MEKYSYILVSPGEKPVVKSTDLAWLTWKLVGDEKEKQAGIVYKDAFILYSGAAAEKDEPINRFIKFDDGRIMAISGDFAIIGKNDKDYISLTKEQKASFLEEFRSPHLFVMAFGKLLIFEIRSRTEINLLDQIDIFDPDEQEETDGEH